MKAKAFERELCLIPVDQASLSQAVEAEHGGKNHNRRQHDDLVEALVSERRHRMRATRARDRTSVDRRL